MTTPHTGLPGGSNSKESTCNVGERDLILGLGRSPGEEKDSPLHAQRMPCTGEPGGLQPMRSQSQDK